MMIHPLSDRVGSQLRGPECGALDGLDLERIKDAVKATGAVYFGGFAADVSQFEQFSNRFSDDFMDNTGSGSYRETADKSHDGTIQNVAYVYGVRTQRTFGLPLHADRSYVKSQPEMIWFLCMRPAREGGQTFICDGVKLYRALSASTRSLFESKRLKYIRNYPADQWQVAFHTDDLDKVAQYCGENDLTLKVHEDGSISTEYLKSAVVERTRFGGEKAFVNSILIQLWQEEALKRPNAQVRMEDGSKIPSEVIDEVKRVSAELTQSLPWESGDFIMIDNTRLMHGRTAFEDPDREVYVRMCRSVEW